MWTELLLKIPKQETMLDFKYQGKELFIANVAGKLFCAKNSCPHEGVKLTLGCLKNNNIKCSLHGFSFSLINGISDEANVDKLQTYPVKILNNKLFIKL